MILENKTAIVTGGSRGIGRAICVALAEAGANVVTCYAHGAAGAEETVKLCEAYGVKASAIQADVAKNEDVQALVAKVKEEYGSIDILVNNAGITKDAEDDGGRFRAGHRHELKGCISVYQACIKDHAQAEAWTYHQHQQRGRCPWKCRTGQLRIQQGGLDRYDKVCCKGDRFPWHYRECGGTWIY